MELYSNSGKSWTFCFHSTLEREDFEKQLRHEAPWIKMRVRPEKEIQQYK